MPTLPKVTLSPEERRVRKIEWRLKRLTNAGRALKLWQRM